MTAYEDITVDPEEWAKEVVGDAAFWAVVPSTVWAVVMQYSLGFSALPFAWFASRCVARWAFKTGRAGRFGSLSGRQRVKRSRRISFLGHPTTVWTGLGVTYLPLIILALVLFIPEVSAVLLIAGQRTYVMWSKVYSAARTGPRPKPKSAIEQLLEPRSPTDRSSGRPEPKRTSDRPLGTHGHDFREPPQDFDGC